MAVDAYETARVQGLSLYAPDRPDLRTAAVDHVARQYPRPGAQVPRESVVYVWFDFGEGEGGGGIREPRGPPVRTECRIAPVYHPEKTRRRFR